MNHYFDENPDIESEPKLVSGIIAGTEYTFTTDRGVFSYEKIDKATRILLDVFDDKFYGAGPNTIVDVGCGYGVIACVMAQSFEEANIIAVDTNQRARDLTVTNYKKHFRNDRLRVMTPQEVDDTLEVDLVISNPPIRIGKEALFELLRGWSTCLSSSGQMWLVIAKNLGADSTAAYLEKECGLKVTRVASKKGFRVFRCVRSK